MSCLRRLEVGDLITNCYILFEKGKGVVIDPGAESERILRELNKEGIRPMYIINTHGHIDHIGACGEVSLATGAPILIHKADAPYLSDPFLNLMEMLGGGIQRSLKEGDVQRFLEGGDVVEVDGIRIEILHTPGHTPGGICLLVKDQRMIFTGDTLFRGGIGRTDLPGGSYKELMDSIRGSLLSLSDDIVIYPGHGPPSTIGDERRLNPFLIP